MKKSKIKKTALALLLPVLLITAACRKDKDKVYPAPTPLTIALPAHITNKYDIPADNPMTVQGVQLGRMLFYEKMLSKDQSISCGSCHQQSKAFTDGLARSKGVNGGLTPVSAMSNVNMLWAGKFHWDGSLNSLEEQALKPIQNPVEMDLSLKDAVKRLEGSALYQEKFGLAFGEKGITAVKIGKALAQFQRSIVSFGSKFDKFIQGDYKMTVAEARGQDLYFTHPIPEAEIRGGNCGDCHLGFLTTGSNRSFFGFHNNGLDGDATLPDGLRNTTGLASDKGKFKAPTLRNIALTAPYMHDGRFATLEDVLDHYSDHIQSSATLDPLILAANNEIGSRKPGLHLNAQEKADIIAFLKMFTDSSLVKNPAYSNPF